MVDTPDITPEATDYVDAIKAQCAALMAEVKKRGHPDMTDAEFAAHVEKVEAESAARWESVKEYQNNRARGGRIRGDVTKRAGVNARPIPPTANER
jgi:hypothetical protein